MIKLFEDFIKSDDKIWEEFKQKIEKRYPMDLHTIINGMEEVIGEFKNIIFSGKNSIISILKEMPLKLTDNQNLTEEMLLTAIYNAETTYRQLTDGAYAVSSWIYNFKELYEKGGLIYRLVYLTDERSLDKNTLGNSWTYDIDMFGSFYDEYINEYSPEQTKNKTPYIITGYIPPKQDIEMGSGDWNLDRPEELEIYVIDPSVIKIKNIKKYN